MNMPAGYDAWKTDPREEWDDTPPCKCQQEDCPECGAIDPYWVERCSRRGCPNPADGNGSLCRDHYAEVEVEVHDVTKRLIRGVEEELGLAAGAEIARQEAASAPRETPASSHLFHLLVRTEERSLRGYLQDEIVKALGAIGDARPPLSVSHHAPIVVEVRGHAHEWFDPKNAVVQSCGYRVCRVCGTMRHESEIEVDLERETA